jgi:hypothetical protein
MRFVNFIKNVNLLAVGVWIVIWNIICGFGIYFNGFGPVETVAGAASMLFAGLFAVGTTFFGLFSARGRRLITASHGDYSEVRPALQLLAIISCLLAISGGFQTFMLTTGHA